MNMNKKKPNTVLIRMTNEMYDTVLTIAEKENACISEVVRYMINEGLNQYAKQ